MRTLLIIIFSNTLISCTAVGVILDGAARSQASVPSTGHFVKNKDGFSFSKFGYEADMTLIELLKGEENTVQVCRQVNKSLKECVDVEKSALHTNKSTQSKTDYEIISVGQ